MNWDSPSKAFAELGIDTSLPGFYDDPRFLEAEKETPQLLELYGRFICVKRFRTDYLNRADHVVRHAVSFMRKRLAAENQIGRCIDASMVLMRFLERQHIWCYAVKGGLTIFFAKPTGLPTCYFAPIMLHDNPAKAGHVWLRAPPFLIADVSVSLQPYMRNEAEHLPPYVLSKKILRCRFDARDLMEPDARQAFAHAYGRPPTLYDLEQMSPGLSDSIRRLGAGEICHQSTRLRYFSTAVSAPIESLEAWKNLQVGGKYPAELYEEFVAELNGV